MAHSSHIGQVVGASSAPRWVRFGCPVAIGQLPTSVNAVLHDQYQQNLTSAYQVTSRWPDGSAKWLLFDALVAGGQQLYLTNGPVATESPSPKKNLTISGYSINVANTLQLRPTLNLAQQSAPVFINGHEYSNNGVCEQLNCEFHCPQAPLLSLRLQLIYCVATEQFDTRVSIVNQAASQHENGCWDLGDKNSLIIDELALHFEFTETQASELVLHSGAGEQQFEVHTSSLQLFQHSSGGDNWQSPVHVDRTGKSPVVKHGYVIETEDHKRLSEGLRASPIVTTSTGQHWQAAQFWQNFPAQLVVNQSRIEYALFPQQTELQPGEGKTWSVAYGPEATGLRVQLNPDYLNHCHVLLGTQLVANNKLTDIIAGGLNGNNHFYAKRERCDEYGWRNFGELYADHEALYVDPSLGIFVSHYNNQYDPILGLNLRYLSTGEAGWQQLQQDLKQHVVDIDIYKTDQDKAEYNFGLFWHTDHYLPALTATHRTYSKHHTAAYEGHQGGGGPGGQHCYTSGLTLHYFLTGDADAKQAVEGLHTWITNFYNGPNSLLSRLFRFLTVDRKPNQLTNIGIVAPGYKYPLDRGTGNYLNALIDRYLLNPEAALLNSMFNVIRLTLSPFDNLAERNLNDIESNWFYVVFLQSLAKYLLLKEQLNQPDAHYHYARHAFNHYAAWLHECEQPYLTIPEKLEFPNDTWAAQDIRKANVLFYAAYFAASENNEYVKRAQYFYDYVASKLAQSEERHTTRVLAILMQNIGVAEWYAAHLRSPFSLEAADAALRPAPSVVKRLITDMLGILKHFSIKTEVNWLKSRLPKREH